MPSEPAYVSALKEYAKASPTVSELDAIENEFFSENDRACGVMFGSWVDMALERAVKSVFRSDLSSTLSKRLFDYEGSVGTFGARINVGYALAIFGQKTFHDLDLIRLIRNEFAHCRRPLRFELAVVKAVCDRLQIPDTEAKRSAIGFGSSVKAITMNFVNYGTILRNLKRGSSSPAIQ